MAEYEHRGPRERHAWFIGLGAGALVASTVYPGVVVDAGWAILGEESRLNIGVGILPYGVIILPEVSYGWMW
jgi:hypothetical protein